MAVIDQISADNPQNGVYVYNYTPPPKTLSSYTSSNYLVKQGSDGFYYYFFYEPVPVGLKILSGSVGQYQTVLADYPTYSGKPNGISQGSFLGVKNWLFVSSQLVDPTKIPAPTPTSTSLTLTRIASPSSTATQTNPTLLPLYAYNLEILYNGSTAVPVNIGTYNVVANFTGSVSLSFNVCTFTIKPSDSFMNLDDDISVVYTGKPVPYPLENIYGFSDTPYTLTYVSTTYPASAQPPTQAGTYMVQLNVTSNSNYRQYSTFTYYTIYPVDNVAIYVNGRDLNKVPDGTTIYSEYTGSANPIATTSLPQGIGCIVKYNGSLTPPTAPGTYFVDYMLDPLDPNLALQQGLPFAWYGRYTIKKPKFFTAGPNQQITIRAFFDAKISSWLIDDVVVS